ncbi:MAG: hypothetical protein ACOCQO_00205 [Halanaerobiaceae bacterium]
MKRLERLKMKHKTNDPSLTGWAVSGLGLLVSTVGSKMIKNKIGAGVLGFGLAHVLLGQLDHLRPSIKKQSYF